VPGIGSQQRVQESSAAARQAYDEERFADFLSRYTGIKLSIPFQKQPRD
jgi:hypothetical protein